MTKLFDIINEDDALLVINKPAGLVCHPTKGDEYSSLISRVRLHLGGSVPPQLINRLDRETSGVVIVAKQPESARELRRLWEAGSVEKRYQAIVHGTVAEKEGVIDAPLGRDEQSAVAIKDKVRADGSPSVTEFALLKSFQRKVTPFARPETLRPKPDGSLQTAQQSGQIFVNQLDETQIDATGSMQEFSLLSIRPLSGRKHQIRIHLAYRGHPIVGDKIYGGDENCYLQFVESRMTEAQAAALILPYQALHAEQVAFTWRGKEMAFRAEPETWFTDFFMGRSDH